MSKLFRNAASVTMLYEMAIGSDAMYSRTNVHTYGNVCFCGNCIDACDGMDSDCMMR